MEKFLSKENAEKRYKELLEASPASFCPLIKGTCRVDCVCYEEVTLSHNTPKDYTSGGPVDLSPTEWYVYPPGCANAMFFGFDQ